MSRGRADVGRRWCLWLIPALALAGCAGLTSPVEPPDVRLAGFSLLEPGLFESRAQVELRFLNPNRFDIAVDALRVDLAVEDIDLAEGRSFEPFVLPAREEVVVPVGIWVQTSGLIDALTRIGTRQQIAYRLDGEAELTDALVARVPFEREGEVRLPDLEALTKFRELELVDPTRPSS
jgi:LEA14-like dessication related protein